MKTTWISIALTLSLAVMVNPTFGVVGVSGDTLPLSHDTMWWQNGGDMSTPAMIGCNGVGKLTVNSGSNLTSSIGYIGLQNGAKGTVTIDGDGSNWTTVADLSVGVLGTGSLNLPHGGAVSAGNNLTVNSTSYLSLLLDSPSPVVTTGGNMVNEGTIRIAVDNWAKPEAIYTPFSIDGTWLNTGDVQAFGGTWNDASQTLTVADSIQIQLTTDSFPVPFDIDLNQNGRAYFLAPGDQQYNQAVMSLPVGNETLHMTVEYSLLGIFADQVGTFAMAWEFTGAPEDTDAFLSFKIGTDCDFEYLKISHDGTIIEPDFLDYTDGWLSFISDASGQYLFTDARPVWAPIPGDANGDGKVDGSDVTILANNWQAELDEASTMEYQYSKGDFNGDNKIDGSDVTILANNWQCGAGITSAAAVPEPSTITGLLTLLLAGFALMYRYFSSTSG